MVTFVHHKIPHDQTRVWTRAAAVGSRRLTAWAMARPNWTFKNITKSFKFFTFSTAEFRMISEGQLGDRGEFGPTAYLKAAVDYRVLIRMTRREQRRAKVLRQELVPVPLYPPQDTCGFPLIRDWNLKQLPCQCKSVLVIVYSEKSYHVNGHLNQMYCGLWHTLCPSQCTKHALDILTRLYAQGTVHDVGSQIFTPLLTSAATNFPQFQLLLSNLHCTSNKIKAWNLTYFADNWVYIVLLICLSLQQHSSPIWLLPWRKRK
jgi:hypothetical protein